MKKEALVFIVDDDSSARKGLVRLIGAAGYNARDFDSANKFLESVDENSSGLILLDIRMPGMSGDELVLELSNRKINLPIIVITADDNVDAKRKAQEMNVVGFYRKPVDGTALLDAINWIFRECSNGKNYL
jgi:two-component system response regulator FixJ